MRIVARTGQQYPAGRESLGTTGGRGRVSNLRGHSGLTLQNLANALRGT
jgi:hypothetical protein